MTSEQAELRGEGEHAHHRRSVALVSAAAKVLTAQNPAVLAAAISGFSSSNSCSSATVRDKVDQSVATASTLCLEGRLVARIQPLCRRAASNQHRQP